MGTHLRIGHTPGTTAGRGALVVLAAAAVAVVWARRPDGTDGASVFSAPVRWFEVLRGPHGNVAP
jgi:hypothetical protein